MRNFVDEYNSLVFEANRLGATEYTTVRRFADAETAERRIDALNTAILNLQDKLSAKEGKNTEFENEKRRLKRLSKATSDGDKNVNTETATSSETATSAPAAKKRAAKKAAAPKKAAKKAAPKKAPAKKAAPAKAAKSAKPSGPMEAILGARSEGTNKAKALKALLDAKGKPVLRSTLVKAVYGKVNEETAKAFAMVAQGLVATVEKAKGFKIVKGQDEKKKEMTFALSSK